MTTTQTGGGNGAAPVGTEGTVPTPERLLPTRPGAWWGRWCDPGEPVEWTVFHVFADMGRLKIIWEGEIWSVGSLEWLAEVPPPAVLAALAEYREAMAGRDSLRGNTISSVVDEVWCRYYEAQYSLDKAIRAERAAQGSAPAGGDA